MSQVHFFSLTAACLLIWPSFVRGQQPSRDKQSEAYREMEDYRRSLAWKARLWKKLNLRRLRLERDPQKLGEAIYDLGNAADEEVIEPLIKVLDDPLKPDGCRASAIGALLRIAANPESTKGASQKILKDAAPRVRFALGVCPSNLFREISGR